jgi:GTPase SAR1 family protein
VSLGGIKTVKLVVVGDGAVGKVSQSSEAKRSVEEKRRD